MPNTQEEVLTNLRLIETHMSYLKEEVSKIGDIQEAIQEFKLSQVERGAVLTAMRENSEQMSRKIDDLAKKVEGGSGVEPLPSRVHSVENRLTNLEGSPEAAPLPSRVKSLEGQVEAMAENEKLLKREKWKTAGLVAVAVISMFGALGAAAINLLGS